MATVPVVAAQQVTPAKVLYYPEAATQSFKKGEFVYLVSGKVTVVPTAAPAQSKIAGLALQDASGVTDTAIAIAVAEEGVMFELNSTSTTAITNVGAVYGLSISSNKHSVNVADTTNTIFHVKALSPKDVAGDTTGRLWVEVLGSRCQLSGQTS